MAYLTGRCAGSQRQEGGLGGAADVQGGCALHTRSPPCQIHSPLQCSAVPTLQRAAAASPCSATTRAVLASSRNALALALTWVGWGGWVAGTVQLSNDLEHQNESVMELTVQLANARAEIAALRAENEQLKGTQVLGSSRSQSEDDTAPLQGSSRHRLVADQVDAAYALERASAEG